MIHPLYPPTSYVLIQALVKTEVWVMWLCPPLYLTIPRSRENVVNITPNFHWYKVLKFLPVCTGNFIMNSAVYCLLFTCIFHYYFLKSQKIADSIWFYCFDMFFLSLVIKNSLVPHSYGACNCSEAVLPHNIVQTVGLYYHFKLVFCQDFKLNLYGSLLQNSFHRWLSILYEFQLATIMDNLT